MDGGSAPGAPDSANNALDTLGDLVRSIPAAVVVIRLKVYYCMEEELFDSFHSLGYPPPYPPPRPRRCSRTIFLRMTWTSLATIPRRLSGHLRPRMEDLEPRKLSRSSILHP